MFSSLRILQSWCHKKSRGGAAAQRVRLGKDEE
jgi:hypothetical protein